MSCENATIDKETAAVLLAQYERLLAELPYSDASVSPNGVPEFYERHGVDGNRWR
jgi:hypothetical protein